MDMSMVTDLLPGEAVWWNDPDDGFASRFYRIATITFTEGMVTIIEPDGSVLETPPGELGFPVLSYASKGEEVTEYPVFSYEDEDEDDGESSFRQGPEKRPVSYVGVYSVTRHYGGGEEGGWWYNITAHELSIPLIRPGDPAEVEEVIIFLKNRYPDEGNIYSVRGGVEYEFRPEATRAQFEDTRRPHYE